MMTLEEAIKHCKDIALSCTNKECALEHFQLLKWLQEYSNMLEKQGEQKPAEWSIFDYRTWQYIVSDVLTKKEGIGQYLDDGTCKNIAKYMQEEWSKKLSVEQRTTELPKVYLKQ